MQAWSCSVPTSWCLELSSSRRSAPLERENLGLSGSSFKRQTCFLAVRLALNCFDQRFGSPRGIPVMKRPVVAHECFIGNLERIHPPDVLSEQNGTGGWNQERFAMQLMVAASV